MFRKCLIIFCCIGMLSCVGLGVANLIEWPKFRLYQWKTEWEDGWTHRYLNVFRGAIAVETTSSYDADADTSAINRSFAGFRQHQYRVRVVDSDFKYLYHGVRIPLYAFFILFAIYPIVAFIRGPLRRRRRRRRNLCPNCGYPTTGNVTGVCPECSSRIAGASGRASIETDSDESRPAQT